MYGIINKAIEELVLHNFNQELWEKIKKRANVDEEFFISSSPYDDDITYNLAIAISEELNVPLSNVLNDFGEWWILKTGKEKYGYLLSSGGDNFKGFLLNLPNFHNSVMMYYPNLTPPEFKISDVEDSSLHLHYFSQRKGLKDFVYGLMTGLAKFFEVKTVKVEHIDSLDESRTHEVFKISW